MSCTTVLLLAVPDPVSAVAYLPAVLVGLQVASGPGRHVWWQRPSLRHTRQWTLPGCSMGWLAVY